MIIRIPKSKGYERKILINLTTQKKNEKNLSGKTITKTNDQ